jgi:peptidase S41-like protein
MSLFAKPAIASDFWDRSPLLIATRDIGADLSVAERIEVCEQLLVLLRDYYVHLPLKRSSLGIDPVQQLLILTDSVQYLYSDGDFFRRLVEIIRSLRDRHTLFQLPYPYSAMVAYLPFALESVTDENGRRHLILSKVMFDVGDPTFVPGVEITHWNGIPVASYIEDLSWSNDGAHPFARIALALRSLTVRPLGYLAAPIEDWVTLSYVGSAGNGATAVPWKVYFPGSSTSLAAAGLSYESGSALVEGLDRSTLAVNGAWFDLYSRQSGAAAAEWQGRWAQNVKSRTVTTSTGKWGYVRIYSFEAEDSAAFVSDFADMLDTLPQDGLILDLRANPGGTIPSGEALARLFTEREVQTEPVCFRNTPAVRAIGDNPSFLSWRRSLDMQIDTGEVFSQAFPLTPATLGDRGRYPGPVVLIIDSLCYSTTDFFVATMQDNGLAEIIGIDPVTGAGGANAWSQATLREIVNSVGGPDLGLLPRGMQVSVPMRRSIRVGSRSGLPVEGVGVFAEHAYALTMRDVLADNADLIEHAGLILAKMSRSR